MYPDGPKPGSAEGSTVSARVASVISKLGFESDSCLSSVAAGERPAGPVLLRILA